MEMILNAYDGLFFGFLQLSISDSFVLDMCTSARPLVYAARKPKKINLEEL